MLNLILDYSKFDKEPITINNITILSVIRTKKNVIIDIENKDPMLLQHALPGFTYDFDRAIFISPAGIIYATEHTNQHLAQYDKCSEAQANGVYYN